MEDHIFEETQKFKQLWIWILLGALAIYVGYRIVDNWDHNLGYSQAYPIVIMLSVLLLFLTMKLHTKITNRHLQYRYTPIINSWKKYSFDEIEKMEIVTYNSLLQFGGWGIRFNAYSWLYNVDGKHGIKVVTAKKKFIIGTRKPGEAAQVLEQFIDYKKNKHA